MLETNRADRFPRGADVRLDALDVDPYPILADLRAHEPVTWVPQTRMWFLTRRDDVVAMLRDADRFTTDAERSTIRDIFGAHMMTTDGDVALRHKRSCLHAFRADVLAQDMTPWVDDWVHDRLERLRREEAFDLMSEIATPLAVGSAMRVLGLPPRLAGDIAAWYDDFAAALANFTGDPEVRARGKKAARAFDEAVRPLLSAALPADRGLLAHLATRGEDRLSGDEIISNALIILFGGIETTASMLGNTVWSLIATGQWDARLTEPAHRAQVTEEALRWQPAVQSITRHVTEDVEIRGVRIPVGSIVQGMIGGANRDPDHFTDPDRFIPARANASDHLAFGTGRHLCLGAHLARIEIGAVLAALASRSDAVVFGRGAAPPLRGYEFRRPTDLWIELR